MYSKFDLTEARKKDDTYRQLKQEFEGAVRDEREAAAIYNRIIDIALMGGCKEFVNEVRSIKEQEEWHEVTFRRLVAEAEKKGMVDTKMVEVEVDVVTVTAYKCTHCEALFTDRDSVFEHLDRCPARPAKSYLETDFGNMILKEGAV